MKNVTNWDQIEERADGFNNPKPGGYVVRIEAVYDDEAKEYLKIEWDYIDGPYKGENERTKQRAGFWPTVLFRSYKESALGFFKAFKTAVETSNPGYTFDCANPALLVGKLIGVVLGEEGYTKKDGSHGTRLYVSAVRSVEAIRSGDYKVPDYKETSTTAAPTQATPASQAFAELDGDDGDLPF